MGYQPVYYAKVLDILGTFVDGAAKPAELALTTSATSKTAWDLLEGSVYQVTRQQEGCSEGILCAEPYFGLQNNKTSAWASGAALYYYRSDVWKAARFLLDQLAAEGTLIDNAAWREFAIDVLRQVAIDGFSSGEARRKPEAFTRLDALLLRSQKWTLWKVWQQARELSREVITAEDGTTTLGDVDNERALRHYRNYLCLMTIWKTTDTTNASKLCDYSHRNLGGMMEAYYGRRWKAYWAGQTQAQIRAVDATWWKTAPIPAEPVAATAADLRSIGEAILADALYTDATGLAPVDWYDFTTADAPDRGTFARGWAAGGSFTLVTGKNGTLGAVTDHKWSNTSTSLQNFTLSIEATCGTTSGGTLFSTDGKDWAIKRGDSAGAVILTGLFASDLTLSFGDDKTFHRVTVAVSGNGATVQVWLDGELKSEGLQAKASAIKAFTAYEVNSMWGGGTASSGTVEDVRIYDQALTDEQVVALCNEPLEPFTWWNPDASDAENRWSVLRHWSRGKPTEGWAGIRTGTEPLTLKMDEAPALTRLETAGEGALTITGTPFTATQLAVGTDTDLAAGLATFAAGNVSIAAAKTLTVNDDATVPLATAGAVSGVNGTLRVKGASFERETIEASEPTLVLAGQSALTMKTPVPKPAGGATWDVGKSSAIRRTLQLREEGQVNIAAENILGWSKDAVLFSEPVIEAADNAVVNISVAQVVHYPIALSGNASLVYDDTKASKRSLKFGAAGSIRVTSGSPTVSGVALGVHSDSTSEATLFDVAQDATLTCAATINTEGKTARKTGAGTVVLTGGFAGSSGSVSLDAGTMVLAGEADYGAVPLNTAADTTLALGTVRSANLGTLAGSVTVTPTPAEAEAGYLTLTSGGTITTLAVAGATGVTQTVEGSALKVAFSVAPAEWRDGDWVTPPAPGLKTSATIVFSGEHTSAVIPEGALFSTVTVTGAGELSCAGDCTADSVELTGGSSWTLPGGLFTEETTLTADAGSTLTLKLGGQDAALPASSLTALIIDTEGDAATPVTLTLSGTVALSGALTTQGASPLTLAGPAAALTADSLAANVSTDLAAGLVGTPFASGKITLGDQVSLTVNDGSTAPLTVDAITGSTAKLCVKGATFERAKTTDAEPALEIATGASLKMTNSNAQTKSIAKTITVSGNGAVAVTGDNVGGWDDSQTQITLFSLRDEATLSFQAIEVLTHIIELQDSAQVEIVKAGGAIFKNGRIHVLGGAPKIVRPAGNATGSLSLQHLTSAGGLTLAEGATLTLELPFTEVMDKSLAVTSKSLALSGTGTLALAADTDLPALTGTGSLLVASGTATFNNGANSSYSGSTTVAEGAKLVLNCANSGSNGVLSANVADGAALTINGTLEGRQGAFYRQVKGSGTISVPAGGSLDIGCESQSGIAGLATFHGTLEVGGTLGLPVWVGSQTYKVSGCNIVFTGSAGKIKGTDNSGNNGKIEVTLSAGKSIFGAGSFIKTATNAMTVVLEAGSTLYTAGTAVTVDGTLTLPASGTVTVSAMDYGPVLTASGLSLEKFALPSVDAQGIFALIDAGATLAMVKKPTPSGQQPGNSNAYAEETLRQVADFVAAKGVYDNFSVVGKTGADRALSSGEIDSALSCFTDLLAYDEANNQVRVDYDFGVNFISLAKLSATTGSLAAGDYVVVCAKVDGNAGSATYADGATVKLCLDGDELSAAPLSTETVNALTGADPAIGEAWFAVPTSDVLTQNGTFKFTVKAVK
ncbi:MAG: alpha-N-acetylglucosaminidase C-terminal domain-containing protein [Candidatus Spyradenecus sp.]